MMKAGRIVLQPTYVLHARCYRETSLLMECLSKEYGRVSIVAKGVRHAKSRMRGLLQPFAPLLMTWYGKTDLYTLYGAEQAHVPFSLSYDALLYGFYANEILLRVLQREDPHPALYDAYQMLLLTLAAGDVSQHALRLFEWRLLQESGVAFSFTEDIYTQQPVEPDFFYRFESPQGFSKVLQETPGAFSGKDLMNFAKGYFSDDNALREMKRLMRLALAPLIGERPLRSRELFL